jgi:hypothetical protein
MGVERMLRHWREIIARWGAYPVTWSITGEPSNLWYFETRDAIEKSGISIDDLLLSRKKGGTSLRELFDRLGLTPKVDQQLKGWNEVARGIRKLDPFQRLATIENEVPGRPENPYGYLEDKKVVDFWRLQTGESGFYSLATSVDCLLTAIEQDPPKPTLVGEINSEGILDSSGPEMQRFTVWSHLLSGAAGHSYQAVGVWDFTTPEHPGNVLGPWGDSTWRESAALAGGKQAGLARKILIDLPWQLLEPHPEWVEPHQTQDNRLRPYAAGTRDGLRLAYFPVAGLMRGLFDVRLLELGPKTWTGQFINPRTGDREAPFDIVPNTQGIATLDKSRGYPLPSRGDWVLMYSPRG